MALLLSIVNNSFKINDKSVQAYTQLVTRFLNFPSYTKVFFTDFLNYFIYKNLKDEESQKFSSVGFCSILVKYKFVSLEMENDKLTNQTKEFGKKIFENLKQFGGLAKNLKFVDYLKEALIDNHEKYLNNRNFIPEKKYQAPVISNINRMPPSFTKVDLNQPSITPIKPSVKVDNSNLFNVEEKIEEKITQKDQSEEVKYLLYFLNLQFL